MAKMDAHQRNDKKRVDGNFKPQGKKGAKKKKKVPTGHVNRYAEFSQAANAMANLEARKEAVRRQAEREERERSERTFGWRPFRW